MIGWAFVGGALAHDFSIIVVGPSPTWCAEIAERAAPADVVQLLPGTYPGGCELALGGLADLNEALLVSATEDGPVIIEADEDGLALRVTGEPTRLLGLTVRGRVSIEANNVTIDTSVIDDLVVDPGVERVTVLFSQTPRVEVELEHAVVRGNQLERLSVFAVTGLVADNAIQGDAASSLPFHRNLVTGELRATGDAFANVLVGPAEVDGRFYGNTALGSVIAGDARNSLTAVAELPAGAGNLRCPDCLLDPSRLDVRPRGAALEAALADADGDVVDFCGGDHGTVGAVGALVELDGQPWTAFDRTRTGCVPGSLPPEIPIEPPDPFVETHEVQPRSCGVVSPGSALWFVMFLPWMRRRSA